MPPYIEKPLFKEGILKPGPFTNNYDLRCYEPGEHLKPYVEHYFISRRRPDFDPDYEGVDVLSQPVVSLFIKPETAYIEGPTTGTRSLRARESAFYAGAQFKPGGFYPFWHQSISLLAEQHVPAKDLLPSLTDVYSKSIVDQTDNQLLLGLVEHCLLSAKPQYDPGIELVGQIVGKIEQSAGNITVSELAGGFGISERSLQLLFKTYVGVGAKWAIMRVRFLEVIKFARQQTRPDWTAVASEFGYSDQSHFINDFKHIVGQSPSQFMRSSSLN